MLHYGIKSSKEFPAIKLYSQKLILWTHIY
nr:MAG TPA: hypothetical protein [Bacteriophage sp.]DAT20559.1 MAG TPA: hypothetical protein [Caudoviricetes sp.]